MLLEPGGPGFDLYERADAGFVALPAALHSTDVLMIREPWASTTASAACRTALRDLGSALSGATASLPGDAAVACPLAGWTAVTYLEALTTILRAENRQLSGIIGQSYGALPAAEAAHRFGDAWLILNAPIAPSSAMAAGLLQGRQNALDAALEISYRQTCETLPAGCSSTGVSVAASALTRTRDHTITRRTEPLRSGDVALAITSAAYDLQANQAWLWPALTKLPNLTDRDWSTIGRLADQLIQRSGGGGDVSPRLAAYFSGVCESYLGWNGTAAVTDDLHLLLRAIGTYCTADLSPPARWTTATDTDRQGTVCIYVNDQDTVVDASDARSWAHAFPRSRVRHLRYLGHLPLDVAAQRATSGPACPLLPASTP